MIRSIKIFLVLALFTILTKIYGHCQVPCGIYDDAVRIVQIEEDITTIRKAMNMINDLAGKSDAQSLNQISRWVTTKESHAQNAQETILNYFLAQRVKAKEKGNKDRQKYARKEGLYREYYIGNQYKTDPSARVLSSFHGLKE